MQKERHYADVPVSVVMPAYNAEKTIGESIESVLNQTHQCFELIIVDDGSTDASLKIAFEYGRKNSKIRVIRNMGNLGVAESRNNAIQVANYNWIAFLDSDDMWEPTKLEKQLDIVSRYPSCSICYTGSAFMDANGNRLQYVLPIPEKITYEELLKQNLISCSSVLAKKQALLQYPMPSTVLIHEDFATWLQILRNEPFAIGITEPLLIYRLSATSKSGNKLIAAKMQWRTYKHLAIPAPKAAWMFAFYAFRSLKKYKAIRRRKT